MKRNKKGFTIVELVIVIGVIAILSAILIPTFVNLASKAEDARAKSEVADAYTAYVLDYSDDKKANSFDGAAGNESIVLREVSQAETAIKRDNYYFVYTETDGWKNIGTSVPQDFAIVADTEAHSTYNKCVVGSYTAA